MTNGPDKPNRTVADNPVFTQIEDLATQLFRDPAEPVPGVKSEIAPNLRALLERPGTIVTTLEDVSGVLEAFSMAIPIGEMDPDRIAESDTAYVYYIGVQPVLPRQEKVALLMEGMHGQLRNEGYGYFELDASIGNGFADELEEAYGEAVMARRDHAGDPYTGPQRSLRVDLSKVPYIS